MEEGCWGAERRDSLEDEVWRFEPEDDAVFRNLSGAGLLVECGEGLGDTPPFGY